MLIALLLYGMVLLYNNFPELDLLLIFTIFTQNAICHLLRL